jgi:murein tripeptide amidase MpaA
LVTEYFAYNLLAEQSAHLDNVDFYIFPVVNPDGKSKQFKEKTYTWIGLLLEVLTTALGFLYTQSNDRLWRKNRLPSSSSSCVGTDINRNWPYKWSVTGGASTDPCAEDYKGTSAGYTVENKALSAYLQQLKSTVGVKLYIDYHSYSQLIMSRTYPINVSH